MINIEECNHKIEDLLEYTITIDSTNILENLNQNLKY